MCFKYKKYIFLYLIDWNKKDIDRLLTLKKETGLPLVLVTLGGRSRGFADQTIFDASPEEFLYLLANAEMVVASSFHGTALSIVFNKPFVAVAGTAKPARIKSLLRHFSLEGHNTLDISMQNALVDYEPVNRQILKDQKEAEDYLVKAFSIEKM